jgi:hypothetical protein
LASVWRVLNKEPSGLIIRNFINRKDAKTLRM